MSLQLFKVANSLAGDDRGPYFILPRRAGVVGLFEFVLALSFSEGLNEVFYVLGRLFNAISRYVKQENLARQDESQSQASRPYEMRGGRAMTFRHFIFLPERACKMVIRVSF